MFQGIRWLLPAAAMVVLTGCAATGPRYAEVESNFPSLRPGYGRVLVYRAAGAGAAVQPEVRLNGELIGKAQPEGFFFVDRAAGRYTLSASTEVRTTAELELTEGATVYVQFSLALGLFVGQPRLTLQPPPLPCRNSPRWPIPARCRWSPARHAIARPMPRYRRALHPGALHRPAR